METSLLDLPPLTLLWCGFVLFAASYIRGFSGFGFTAVLMIGLSMALPMSQIVPLSIALEVLASSGQAYGIFRDVNWRRLGVLVMTGVLGTPLGLYLLGSFPNASLRSLTLIFVAGSSAYLIVARRSPRRFSNQSYALAGFTIGVVNGATALSGLALALFLSLSDTRPAQMRATMIFYLFLADIWTGGLLLASGYYDGVTLGRVLVAIPILVLGVWLGSRRFAASPPPTFRKAMVWLLLALSAFGLALDMVVR